MSLWLMEKLFARQHENSTVNPFSWAFWQQNNSKGCHMWSQPTKRHLKMIRNATHHEPMHIDPYLWESPSTSLECGIRQKWGWLACITQWVSCKGCELFSSASNPWSITTQSMQFKAQQYSNTNSTFFKSCWLGTQKNLVSIEQTHKLESTHQLLWGLFDPNTKPYSQLSILLSKGFLINSRRPAFIR